MLNLPSQLGPFTWQAKSLRKYKETLLFVPQDSIEMFFDTTGGDCGPLPVKIVFAPRNSTKARPKPSKKSGTIIAEGLASRSLTARTRQVYD